VLMAADAEMSAQNGVGTTPLHAACTWGRWDCVRQLLAGDAAGVVGMTDKQGKTPGHCALSRGEPIPEVRPCSSCSQPRGRGRSFSDTHSRPNRTSPGALASVQWERRRPPPTRSWCRMSSA
jgi:hypothetical protein